MPYNVEPKEKFKNLLKVMQGKKKKKKEKDDVIKVESGAKDEISAIEMMKSIKEMKKKK